MKKTYIIGIAGGTGSGKTTIANKIVKYLGKEVVFIQHDSYYRDLTHLTLKERQRVNYDHPDSLETELLLKHLRDLINKKTIKIPVYDFSQHNRSKETKICKPKNIIIIEGILVLFEEELRKLMDIKIFVETDADVRLGRRIKRDILERGRTLEFSLDQYLTKSKPMHEAFVEPSKKYADIIIPEGGENETAIDTLVHMIKRYK